jgi:hypothetical protein
LYRNQAPYSHSAKSVQDSTAHTRGVVVSDDGKVALDSSSSNVTQVAISHFPDFDGIAWQPFYSEKFNAIEGRG